jgi:hypothetical protein
LKRKVTATTAALRFHVWRAAFIPLLLICAAAQLPPHRDSGEKPRPPKKTWHFAVSGDSRNCGDVVMPAIAGGVLRDRAIFYWHLGDLRWITYVDQDFKQLGGEKWNLLDMVYYERHAWDDFIQNQMSPFGSLPFYLGIGNHETTVPKSRDEFVEHFTDWLDAPAIREQRLKDDPSDHKVKTYYHWIHDGIDFINLDNATHDQFDDAQMKWLEGVLARDRANAAIFTVVVGMHEALPTALPTITA